MTMRDRPAFARRAIGPISDLLTASRSYHAAYALKQSLQERLSAIRILALRLFSLAPATDKLATVVVPFTEVWRWCQHEGLVAAAAMPVPVQLDGQFLATMLADGVGDMTWLADQRELRLRPAGLWPGAASPIIATVAHEPAGGVPSQRLRQVRYARGKDYHKLFRQKLARIGRQLDALVNRDEPGCRATVDSAPVNERQLALLAGIGWLGRNGLVIQPASGSYQFIGVIFTKSVIETYAPTNGADRCGICRACETACPTAALQDRRVLSERCISYLTIEHQGVIARDLASALPGLVVWL